MNNVKIFVSVIIILIVGVIATVLVRGTGPSISGPGEYDAFAQCITDKGAIFYGAFWCPHCQAQKKMFGSSAKLLPYVECSTPDGNGQIQACIDKGVTNYPTWLFPDGSRLTGEVALPILAEKTGCAIAAPVSTEVQVEAGASSPAQ